jgi:hypothetical protein
MRSLDDCATCQAALVDAALQGAVGRVQAALSLPAAEMKICACAGARAASAQSMTKPSV